MATLTMAHKMLFIFFLFLLYFYRILSHCLFYIPYISFVYILHAYIYIPILQKVRTFFCNTCMHGIAIRSFVFGTFLTFQWMWVNLPRKHSHQPKFTVLRAQHDQIKMQIDIEQSYKTIVLHGVQILPLSMQKLLDLKYILVTQKCLVRSRSNGPHRTTNIFSQYICRTHI